jgi:hypothetical protein
MDILPKELNGGNRRVCNEMADQSGLEGMKNESGWQEMGS